ncbi:energy-coupling factor transporter ATP-binding protein EcfA2 [Marinithermofilum abyssi]|uniref:Energy-coupling factor transporter ATP-binding protein EcfA2 n=1 Tax=Marinithermofilum abyssi TaxID=1571185 RepID=A0A8J2VIA3_9BACL|nr:energy-coupling factor transporter ATPase [Marinithermofilum abyssi]GGE20753.1 energy-coupling factor transporter ATP-binding protein EcfA2 [Marinithermofilum abyssi]
MGIVIEGLSHVYMAGTPFAHTALQDVSLRMEAGSFIGIVGPTGSGKSTLIQLIAGLLRPTQGRVRVFDAVLDPETKNRKPFRKWVSVVFQYPEHQLFEETVAKDIAFGPRNLGLSPEEVEQRVEQAMAWAGLPSELADLSPFHLSGGQMRRVALAGVLAMQPRVLILDEPTAGLDPRGQRELLETIRQIQREQKMTVIMVSHSMEEISRHAERMFVMHRGRLVAEGTPEQVFAHGTRLREWGLEVPEWIVLAEELNRNLHPPLPQGIRREEDLASSLLARWKEGKSG